MVCLRCKLAVKSELKKMGYEYANVDIGEADLTEQLSDEELKDLRNKLKSLGLEVISDKKNQIVEQIIIIINEILSSSDSTVSASDISIHGVLSRSRINTTNVINTHIDEKLSNYMTVKNTAAFTHLFDLINQAEEILTQNIQFDKPLPLNLEAENLSKSVFFLSCLVCGQPALIHCRTLKEMQTWGDVPFFVKCEIQLHAVCSLQCLDTLRKEHTQCPVCVHFMLDFESATVDRSSMHPTLEALRRTTGGYCICEVSGQEYISLLQCAHEICAPCVRSRLADPKNEDFSCPICQQVTDRAFMVAQFSS